MGEDCDCWASQLQNDLENLYLNQGLQFIGGYNKAGSSRELKFVMYNTMDNYNITNEFDFEVDTFYGPIENKDFESYLNDKYTKDNYMYITAFSIDRSTSLKELLINPKLLIHIIIFQNLKINFGTNKKFFEFKTK